ncbi:MAG: hypothetical protein RIR79_43 [Pseudomonadota bacterium]|jgi:drug/metabolite transporter (DMT)-like permease
MVKNIALSYFFLALSMALVGSYVALSKTLVMVFGVFLLAWLRFGIGGLAMLHWLPRQPHEPPLDAPTKRLLFLEAFLGNFLFSITMLFGVSMTSAVSAGVIMATIPAVVALLSWRFLKEKITLRVGFSVALGALGIMLSALSVLSNSQHTTHSPSAIAGNFLVFLAVVCEASYAVIGKKLTGTVSPKRITALINLWGFLLMTPLGLYAAWQFDFFALTTSTVGLLLFYAMAASVWSVWLWMTGLQGVPASRAGVFTVMLPISAAAVGVLVLGESFNALQAIAFAMALAGVVLATTSP